MFWKQMEERAKSTSSCIFKPLIIFTNERNCLPRALFLLNIQVPTAQNFYKFSVTLVVTQWPDFINKWSVLIPAFYITLYWTYKWRLFRLFGYPFQVHFMPDSKTPFCFTTTFTILHSLTWVLQLSQPNFKQIIACISVHFNI